MARPKDLVSVIISTRNEDENLERLLKSVVKQNYKQTEVLVVDNNSADDTKKIALKYTPLVYNCGPERSAQRNYGAKKASGKYYLFLDADMELENGVIEECVEVAVNGLNPVIIIPEKTVISGLFSRIRSFEREMYVGDETIELARFYKADVFQKLGGFDTQLTGPEDYDLFYRAQKKYLFGRIKAYILHHEEKLSLLKLLRKKYYYAYHGANYADKHPELILTQGTIIWRRAYLRNWRKFLQQPMIGGLFIVTRVLETCAALWGYIRAVGIVKFGHSLFYLFN